MRYPWLTALVIVVVAAAALVGYWRGSKRQPSEVSWLANTAELRMLPAYRRALSRSRWGTALAAGLLATFSLSIAVVAGAPVSRHIEHPKLASRDVVLCLDASGSMLPYDGKILRQFDEMVQRFQGERLALQVWSAQSVTKFPLTDDYEMISEVLQEGANIIDRGYLGEDGAYVLVSPELSDYLDGIDAPDGAQISSLVGDGLASCVLGFDHLDTERSRTVLLATDNEVMGEQIYSLAEAVEFAGLQDVEIFALNPGSGLPSAEAEQMKYVVESAGGSFYEASDPAAIAEIIERIEAQQAQDLGGEAKVVETDLPQTAMNWAAWSLMGFLLVAALRRL